MIKFRMFGIHIDQFAILSKSAPLEDLGLGVNLNYKYANKGRNSLRRRIKSKR